MTIVTDPRIDCDSRHGRAIVLRGNARNLPLPDNSVDLVITSPPYWALRSYQDGGQHYDGQIGAEPTPAEYVDSLINCTREWMRVVKPSGSIWVNLGDKYNSAASNQGMPGGAAEGFGGGSMAGKSRPGRGTTFSGARTKSLFGLPWRYAIRCIDDLGLTLRAEVIWSKPNGLPESVKDRVRRSHEQWFHFTLGPKYFAAVDTIRQPHKSTPDDRGVNCLEGQRQMRPTGPNSGAYNPIGVLPGSVWEIATQPLTVPVELGVDHFAAFPMEWPRRIIQGWSPVGGVVLDPFGGTGTTALVAKALGRTGISVDMSGDYCRLARWRTTDPGQFATARQVPKPEPQHEAQLDLFAELGAVA